MGWITIGVVVSILFLIFLGLYFWSSGALVIADEEKGDIKNKTSAEIADELKEVKKEDEEETKSEENDFYSHG